MLQFLSEFMDTGSRVPSYRYRTVPVPYSFKTLVMSTAAHAPYRYTQQPTRYDTGTGKDLNILIKSEQVNFIEYLKI
jgi:hypothetical protein